MSPSPNCRDGSSSKLLPPFSPALRLRPRSSRWSKWAERPVPAFACDSDAPCCCCCCWGCSCVVVAPKREDWPRPLVCYVLLVVVACDVGLLKSPPKLLGCACVCGCEVDPAPANSEGVVVAAGFAPPKPPKSPPPVLGACVVLDCAFEVPPPRLPNKLGVVPPDAPVVAPNSPPPDVPEEAGWEPPRLPKSDMVVVRGGVVDGAENKPGETRSRCSSLRARTAVIPVFQVRVHVKELVSSQAY